MRSLSLSSGSYLLCAGFSFIAVTTGAGCADIDGASLSDTDLLLSEMADGPSVVASSGVTVGAGGAGGVSVGVGGSSSTSVTVGVGGAGGGPEPPPGPAALGFWKLDDCSDASSALLDSSGNDLTATRSPSVACAPGIDGLAASFDAKADIIEVPHDPAIVFDQHVAVAAWVNPTDVTGNNPIIYQRDSGKAAFHLGINNGKAVFQVGLVGGKTVTTSIPVSANAWTHLAGLYDGEFIFLFRNGQQVGQIFAQGEVVDLTAPLHIGKNGNTNRFDGLIDEVWLSNGPVSVADIQSLSCLQRPTTFSLTPATSGPVAPETSVEYALTVKNNDVGACPASAYFVSPDFQPDFSISIGNNFVEVDPGEEITFPITVTSSSEAEAGVHEIPVTVFELNGSEFLPAALTYEIVEPTGCFVRTSRELLIRHLSVVDDPVRTAFNAPGDPRNGVWTFGKLMEDMAPTPEAAPEFVEQMLSTWLSDQTVNGLVIPDRQALQGLVLDSWPRTEDGKLDLTQAPLNLLAIVNRMDLRDLSAGRAGEGRFVFGVLDPNGFPTQFTVIFEYNLPASTEQDVLNWANAWHALGSLPFPSEQYNAALEAITTQFAGRGAAPSSPNGSALSQLRTNEIALDAPWELREFKISATTGLLTPDTVKLTPDLSFDGTQTLADFVNQNEATILQEKHVVPETFGGGPFLGAASLNNLTAWAAPGINNNEARHRFSLNTCNGCHGFAETGTQFLHVFPRFPGQQADLSGFMTGITMPDPVSGEPRTFNDLGRRKVDLQSLVCPIPTVELKAGAGKAAKGAKGAKAGSGSPTSIGKGINRVH
jgi:hypothetical protein